MKKSYDGMIFKLQRLPNVGVKFTMKNGSVIRLRDFEIDGDVAFDKNGRCANISDINDIEIDSD